MTLDHIKKLSPYNPPTEGRTSFEGTRLDFNERSVDPKFLKSVFDELLINNQVHIYPEYGELEAAIAGYCSVKPEQIMLSAGSDQGIETIFRTYTQKGDKVIIPEPTFSMFAQNARVAGSRLFSPSYASDMAYPTNEVLDLIDDDTRLVVIVTPNNPTGTSVSLEDITSIAKKAANAAVIVDEAYFEFSGVTATGLVQACPNLIILRTFSKAFGLAGLRVGYAVADRENIEQMKKVRSPYGVNAVAVAAAKKALEQPEDMQDYVSHVNDVARPYLENFFDNARIKYYKSDANLILFQVKDSQSIYEKLKEAGILTRPQNKPEIKNTIRVTVTDAEEMKEFASAYKRLFL